MDAIWKSIFVFFLFSQRNLLAGGDIEFKVMSVTDSDKQVIRHVSYHDQKCPFDTLMGIMGGWGFNPPTKISAPIWHLGPAKLATMQCSAYIFLICHRNLILLHENCLNGLNLALVIIVYGIFRRQYLFDNIFRICSSRKELEQFCGSVN